VGGDAFEQWRGRRRLLGAASATGQGAHAFELPRMIAENICRAVQTFGPVAIFCAYEMQISIAHLEDAAQSLFAAGRILSRRQAK
jgi:hypothetical protein